MTDESTPKTYGDIYDRHKRIYAELLKCSKRSLAHYVGYREFEFVFGNNEQSEARLKQVIEEVKKWDACSRSERRTMRLDRLTRNLSDPNWRPPKRRRRRAKKGA